MSSTVELSSDNRRTMVVHVAWHRLQTFSEDLHSLGWPMLCERNREVLDRAERDATLIGVWGQVLRDAQDPEKDKVELPIGTDELRFYVGDYIGSVYENDLREAKLEQMQGLLDHVTDAQAFLESIGGPIEREAVSA